MLLLTWSLWLKDTFINNYTTTLATKYSSCLFLNRRTWSWFYDIWLLLGTWLVWWILDLRYLWGWISGGYLLRCFLTWWLLLAAVWYSILVLWGLNLTVYYLRNRFFVVITWYRCVTTTCSCKAVLIICVNLSILP